MKESTGTITTTYRQRIDRLMWRPAIVHMLLCLGVGLFTGGWFLAVGVIVLAAGATALVTLRPSVARMFQYLPIHIACLPVHRIMPAVILSGLSVAGWARRSRTWNSAARYSRWKRTKAR